MDEDQRLKLDEPKKRKVRKLKKMANVDELSAKKSQTEGKPEHEEQEKSMHTLEEPATNIIIETPKMEQEKNPFSPESKAPTQMDVDPSQPEQMDIEEVVQAEDQFGYKRLEEESPTEETKDHLTITTETRDLSVERQNDDGKDVEMIAPDNAKLSCSKDEEQFTEFSKTDKSVESDVSFSGSNIDQLLDKDELSKLPQHSAASTATPSDGETGKLHLDVPDKKRKHSPESELTKSNLSLFEKMKKAKFKPPTFKIPKFRKFTFGKRGSKRAKPEPLAVVKVEIAAPKKKSESPVYIHIPLKPTPEELELERQQELMKMRFENRMKQKRESESSLKVKDTGEQEKEEKTTEVDTKVEDSKKTEEAVPIAESPKPAVSKLKSLETKSPKKKSNGKKTSPKSEKKPSPKSATKRKLSTEKKNEDDTSPEYIHIPLKPTPEQLEQEAKTKRAKPEEIEKVKPKPSSTTLKTSPKTVKKTKDTSKGAIRKQPKSTSFKDSTVKISKDIKKIASKIRGMQNRKKTSPKKSSLKKTDTTAPDAKTTSPSRKRKDSPVEYIYIPLKGEVIREVVYGKKGEDDDQVEDPDKQNKRTTFKDLKDFKTEDAPDVENVQAEEVPAVEVPKPEEIKVVTPDKSNEKSQLEEENASKVEKQEQSKPVIAPKPKLTKLGKNKPKDETKSVEEASTPETAKHAEKPQAKLETEIEIMAKETHKVSEEQQDSKPLKTKVKKLKRGITKDIEEEQSKTEKESKIEEKEEKRAQEPVEKIKEEKKDKEAEIKEDISVETPKETLMEKDETKLSDDKDIVSKVDHVALPESKEKDIEKSPEIEEGKQDESINVEPKATVDDTEKLKLDPKEDHKPEESKTIMSKIRGFSFKKTLSVDIKDELPIEKKDVEQMTPVAESPKAGKESETEKMTSSSSSLQKGDSKVMSKLKGFRQKISMSIDMIDLPDALKPLTPTKTPTEQPGENLVVADEDIEALAAKLFDDPSKPEHKEDTQKTKFMTKLKRGFTITKSKHPDLKEEAEPVGTRTPTQPVHVTRRADIVNLPSEETKLGPSTDASQVPEDSFKVISGEDQEKKEPQSAQNQENKEELPQETSSIEHQDQKLEELPKTEQGTLLQSVIDEKLNEDIREKDKSAETTHTEASSPSSEKSEKPVESRSEKFMSKFHILKKQKSISSDTKKADKKEIEPLKEANKDEPAPVEYIHIPLKPTDEEKERERQEENKKIMETEEKHAEDENLKHKNEEKMQGIIDDKTEEKVSEEKNEKQLSHTPKIIGETLKKDIKPLEAPATKETIMSKIKTFTSKGEKKSPTPKKKTIAEKTEQEIAEPTKSIEKPTEDKDKSESTQQIEETKEEKIQDLAKEPKESLTSKLKGFLPKVEKNIQEQATKEENKDEEDLTQEKPDNKLQKPVVEEKDENTLKSKLKGFIPKMEKKSPISKKKFEKQATVKDVEEITSRDETGKESVKENDEVEMADIKKENLETTEDVAQVTVKQDSVQTKLKMDLTQEEGKKKEDDKGIETKKTDAQKRDVQIKDQPKVEEEKHSQKAALTQSVKTTWQGIKQKAKSPPFKKKSKKTSPKSEKRTSLKRTSPPVAKRSGDSPPVEYIHIPLKPTAEQLAVEKLIENKLKEEELAKTKELESQKQPSPQPKPKTDSKQKTEPKPASKGAIRKQAEEQTKKLKEGTSKLTEDIKKFAAKLKDMQKKPKKPTFKTFKHGLKVGSGKKLSPTHGRKVADVKISPPRVEKRGDSPVEYIHIPLKPTEEEIRQMRLNEELLAKKEQEQKELELKEEAASEIPKQEDPSAEKVEESKTPTTTKQTESSTTLSQTALDTLKKTKEFGMTKIKAIKEAVQPMIEKAQDKMVEKQEEVKETVEVRKGTMFIMMKPEETKKPQVEKVDAPKEETLSESLENKQIDKVAPKKVPRKQKSIDQKPPNAKEQVDEKPAIEKSGEEKREDENQVEEKHAEEKPAEVKAADEEMKPAEELISEKPPELKPREEAPQPPPVPLKKRRKRDSTKRISTGSHHYEAISKEDEEDGLKRAVAIPKDDEDLEKEVNVFKLGSNMPEDNVYETIEVRHDGINSIHVFQNLKETPDGSEETRLPRLEKKWSETIDHEYEPINPPDEPSKLSSELQQSSVHTAQTTDVSKVTKVNEPLDEPRLLRIPLDRDLIVPSSQTDLTSTEDQRAAEPPKTEAPAVMEISPIPPSTQTQPVGLTAPLAQKETLTRKPPALEESHAHKLQEKFKTQAGKLKTKLKSMKKPTFTIPNPKFSPKFRRPKFTSAKQKSKPGSEKSRSDRTRSDGSKSDRSRSDGSKNDRPRSDGSKSDRPRSDVTKPDRTKPHGSRFHAPKFQAPKFQRPKFQKPNFQRPRFDTSKFSMPKMPDMPTISFPSFSLPRAGAKKNTTTESADSRRNIFDFRTYPRFFDKSNKTRDNITTTTPSDEASVPAEFATVPRAAARKKGPVGARWVHRFSDIKYADDDSKGSPTYRDELSSKDRGDSLERRMEADFRYRQALEEADDDMRDYERETQDIHLRSYNADVPDRWKHGSFKKPHAPLEDMEHEFDLKDEPETEEPSKHSNIDEHSSIASSVHRAGVLEEIDSDQFFLREKGISQDNIHVGLYLSSEIRDAFRQPPANALTQMEGVQPPYGSRDYELEASDLSLSRPSRPKRKHFKKTKKMKKTPHASEENISYDQESINTEPDDYNREFSDYKTFPPSRPKRAKKLKGQPKVLHVTQVDIPIDDDLNAEDVPVKSQEDLREMPNILGYVDQDLDISEEYNKYLNEERLMYENELMEGIEQPEIVISPDQKYEIAQNDIDKYLQQTGMMGTPRPPARRQKSLRSLTASEHDSIIGEFNRDKGIHDMPEQEINVFRVEHEYIIPADEIPVPPARRYRSRSRSSHGDDDRTSRGVESIEMEECQEPPCVEDLRDSMGYAVIDKSAKREPPLPKRRRSTKSNKSARSTETKFFTVPRPLNDTPPTRPTRNYSTLGPNRPPRKKSEQDLQPEDEKENIDMSQYIEIEDDEHSRDLQSGEVISKMIGRPLPAPPRPPRKTRDRSKEALRDITQETNIQMAGDDEKGVSTASPPEAVEEITVSTQTDPLPDDFCCEEVVQEPTDRIVAPSRRKRSVQRDSSLDSRPKTPLERSMTPRSYRRDSSLDAERAGERSVSPHAMVIEKRVQTPIEDQTLTHASLLVRPVAEYPPDSYVSKRFGADIPDILQQPLESPLVSETAASYAAETDKFESEASIVPIETNRFTIESSSFPKESSSFVPEDTSRTAEPRVQEEVPEVFVPPSVSSVATVSREDVSKPPEKPQRRKSQSVPVGGSETVQQSATSIERVTMQDVTMESQNSAVEAPLAESPSTQPSSPQVYPTESSPTKVPPPRPPPPAQHQVVERIIERPVPFSVTPGPDTEVEVLRAQRLQVSDLDVERLNVSELQAQKILVSEIDGVSLQISELTSKSGNLVVNGLEIPAGLIQELLDRLQPQSQTQLLQEQTVPTPTPAQTLTETAPSAESNVTRDVEQVSTQTTSVEGTEESTQTVDQHVKSEQVQTQTSLDEVDINKLGFTEPAKTEQVATQTSLDEPTDDTQYIDRTMQQQGNAKELSKDEDHHSDDEPAEQGDKIEMEITKVEEQDRTDIDDTHKFVEEFKPTEADTTQGATKTEEVEIIKTEDVLETQTQVQTTEKTIDSVETQESSLVQVIQSDANVKQTSEPIEDLIETLQVSEEETQKSYPSDDLNQLLESEVHGEETTESTELQAKNTQPREDKIESVEPDEDVLKTTHFHEDEQEIRTSEILKIAVSDEDLMDLEDEQLESIKRRIRSLETEMTDMTTDIVDIKSEIEKIIDTATERILQDQQESEMMGAVDDTQHEKNQQDEKEVQERPENMEDEESRIQDGSEEVDRTLKTNQEEEKTMPSQKGDESTEEKSTKTREEILQVQKQSKTQSQESSHSIQEPTVEQPVDLKEQIMKKLLEQPTTSTSPEVVQIEADLHLETEAQIIQVEDDWMGLKQPIMEEIIYIPSHGREDFIQIEQDLSDEDLPRLERPSLEEEIIHELMQQRYLDSFFAAVEQEEDNRFEDLFAQENFQSNKLVELPEETSEKQIDEEQTLEEKDVKEEVSKVVHPEDGTQKKLETKSQLEKEIEDELRKKIEENTKSSLEELEKQIQEQPPKKLQEKLEQHQENVHRQDLHKEPAKPSTEKSFLLKPSTSELLKDEHEAQAFRPSETKLKDENAHRSRTQEDPIEHLTESSQSTHSHAPDRPPLPSRLPEHYEEREYILHEMPHSYYPEYIHTIPSQSFYTVRTEEEIPVHHRRRRHHRRFSRSSSEEEERRTTSRRRTTRSPEPTISQLSCQLVKACSNSTGRFIKQLVNSISSQLLATEQDKQHFKLALIILLVLIAGLILLGYGNSGKTIHLHHWEYFNPPNNF